MAVGGEDFLVFWKYLLDGFFDDIYLSHLLNIYF